MGLRAQKTNKLGPAGMNLRKSGLDSLFKKRGVRVQSPRIRSTAGTEHNRENQRPLGGRIRLILCVLFGAVFLLALTLGIVDTFTARNLMLMGVACLVVVPNAVPFWRGRLQKRQRAKSRSIDKYIPQRIGDMELTNTVMGVEVAGMRYAEVKAERLRLGDRVDIMPEPDNPNDPMAMRLSVIGAHLGYILRGEMQALLGEWFRKGWKARAYVSDVDAQAQKVQVCLAFYTPAKYELLRKSGARSRVFRLAEEGGRKVKIAIDGCYCGEEVSVDIDYEKDKHLVYAGGPIGSLSPSSLSFIDGLDDYLIFVEDKETAENGRTVVKVRVFDVGAP
ncbi:MAG: HIRAN domain-containing protein [Firmicutes bacterium]|nr:HIRAN domain-containing protein [Bacillota bacterium]